jgi:hypothetical protein
MKLQRIAVGLTVINLALMIFLMAQFRKASADEIAPILRGRALEIVDTQGRVRANISVFPPTTMNGKTYPETVLFRLTDPKNGPAVKLTATEEGTALWMSDDADGGISLHARGSGSYVKVVDNKGREQVVKP